MWLHLFDGRNSHDKRVWILKSKTADVLILPIQTGCKGLNLQENFTFFSPHWNPTIEDQEIALCIVLLGTQNQCMCFVSRWKNSLLPR